MKILTRREVLGSLAGIASLPLFPELAQALSGMRTAADWRIAFADLESICHRPPSPAFRVKCLVTCPELFTATALASGVDQANPLLTGSTATAWSALFPSPMARLC